LPADRSYAVGGGTGAGHYKDGKKRTVKVSRSELAGAAKSKLDFYNILAKEGQYYLPPYTECTMLFIRDITMGKKKVKLRLALLHSYYRYSKTRRSGW
jgi:hypothetical protein